MKAADVFACDDGDVEGTSAMDQACLAVSGSRRPLEALLRCGGEVRAPMFCQALSTLEHQPEVTVKVLELLLEHEPKLPSEAYDMLEDAREDFESEEQQAAIAQIGQLIEDTKRKV